MRGLDPGRTKVFVGYAPEDAPFRDALEKHLSALKRRGRIELWHEARVLAGGAWEAETWARLGEADMVLLLVSPDFVASDRLWNELLGRALQRSEREGVPVIPVLVRAVDIAETPLCGLQALPMSGEPIGDAGNDEVWTAVVREIDAIERKEGSQDLALRADIERPNDFVRRVERLCRLREEGAAVARCHAPEPFIGLWELERVSDGQVHVMPLAALDRTPTADALDAFERLLDERYREEDPHVRSVLVYRGDLAPESLVKRARRHGIELRTFETHNHLVDFRRYVERQTARLDADPVYPPALYVEQRGDIFVGSAKRPIPNALDDLLDLLTSDQPQFVLVLADFGTGKTFLLHEIARRLGEDKKAPVVPVLVELRALEKSHSLDALLSHHFALAGERDVHLDRVFDLLEQGRLALLFDGFDELTLRVSYDRAAEHLETLMEASRGRAKVVVTSRTQHFLSEGDVQQALARRAERISHRQIVRLLPFDEAQILAFLTKKLGSDTEAKKRFALLDQIKDLLGLSHNPRMLSFIADLEEDKLREARARTGTVTAAGLYELLMEKWIGYEFWRAHPRGAPPALDAKGRWKAVIVLAEHLWGGIEKSLDPTVLPEDVQRDLRSLGPAEQDAKVTVHQIASGTLLVRDAQGRFSFMHRSVMEFAVAWQAAAYVRANKATRLLDACELSPLAADFFADLVSRDNAIRWAETTLAGEGGEAAKKNAQLMLDRMQVVSRASVVMRGQDLRGRDFSGSDLRGADFSESDLSEATLAGANLEGALFANAKLVRANLSKAHLAKADLRRADLSFGRLTGADLRRAKLFGTVLHYTKLVGVRTDPAALQGFDTLGAALGQPTRADPATLPAASGCNAVAVSPDGSLLAVGDAAGSVVLWDLALGVPLRVLVGHAAAVNSVAFAPNGKLLASGSSDKTIRLWEVGAGRLLRILEGHKNWVHSVAFAQDGKLLASGSDDRSIGLWEVATGRLVQLIKGPQNGVHGVAFSPDGEILASGSGDQLIRLWEVATGKLVQLLDGHRHRVLSVAFAPDGKCLASGSGDMTVRLWEVATGRLLRSFQGHQNPVQSVVFAPDGKLLASASGDKTVRLWEVATGKLLHVLEGHQNVAQSVAFASDGKTLASASDDQTVRLWEVATGKLLHLLKGHKNWVLSVAFAPDGKTLASGSCDQAIRLWEVGTGKLLQFLEEHRNWVLSVAFAPDGKTLASGYYDKTLRLWDVGTGKRLQLLEGHENVVRSVAFAPGGKLLASGSSDTTAKLWQVETGRLLRSLEGHQNGVLSVAFSLDGKLLASGSYDKTIRLWEVRTGKLLHLLKGHQNWVRSVAFAPGGKLLASGSSDTTVKLWEVESGRLLRSLEGHQNGVLSVSFSPDGKLLACGSSGTTVGLWEVESGKLFCSLEGHRDWVQSVVFSPDGKLLASGSNDNTIRLWQVGTGRCLAVMVATQKGWAAFTPDGRYKLSGDAGGSFWHVIGLCRFEPGELDEYIPGLRMTEDEPLFVP
jgi:WD40 repeat protein/type II secretory pathway predicted ATPase ExeA